MTRTLIVIPARFASTRLPGKPLLDRTGKPLVVHTCEAAAAAGADEVLVATDDERIAAAVRRHGYEAAMTSPAHSSGTARIAEAAKGRKADVIVNLQGDEPEADPESLRILIALHEKAAREVLVSTLVSPFPDDADPTSPNAVKAVLSRPLADDTCRALWFSRSLLPYPRQEGGAAPLLHIGVYAFTPQGLEAFCGLPDSPCGMAESLEQLRVLEHGHAIGAVMVPPAAPGIDTPADYESFVARMAAGG